MAGARLAGTGISTRPIAAEPPGQVLGGVQDGSVHHRPGQASDDEVADPQAGRHPEIPVDRVGEQGVHDPAGVPHGHDPALLRLAPRPAAGDRKPFPEADFGMNHAHQGIGERRFLRRQGSGVKQALHGRLVQTSKACHEASSCDIDAGQLCIRMRGSPADSCYKRGSGTKGETIPWGLLQLQNPRHGRPRACRICASFTLSTRTTAAWNARRASSASAPCSTRRS